MGMFGNTIVGLFLRRQAYTHEIYLEILQEISVHLDEIFQDQAIRENIILQQDGAPIHFAMPVRDYLNGEYDVWIGRGGPWAWPPRSPDFNPLDFHCWGRMEHLVYDRRAPATVEELEERIEAAAVQLDQQHLFLATHSVVNRAEMCLNVGGGHFEHLR